MPTISKFGFRLGVAATWATIWPGVAAAYPFPAAAATIRVAAGGDAADDAAGIGAQSVRVYGLDDAWLEVDVVLPTAGALAGAASTQTFRRVFRVAVETAGTSEENVGDVSIEQVGGDVLAVIPAGYGQSEQAIYTIPAGYRATIDAGRFYAEGTKPADLRVIVRTGIAVGAPSIVRRTLYVAFGVDGPDDPGVKHPTSVVGPADVWIEGRSTVAARVSARFEGDLVRI